jgi:hypothetical protein
VEETQRSRRLLGAQIIAVADALDAMTSDRPYRQALPLDEAMREFRRLKGTQWLPAVVDALEALVASPEQQRALNRVRFSVMPSATADPAAAEAGTTLPAAAPVATQVAAPAMAASA